MPDASGGQTIICSVTDLSLNNIEHFELYVITANRCTCKHFIAALNHMANIVATLDATPDHNIILATLNIIAI